MTNKNPTTPKATTPTKMKESTVVKSVSPTKPTPLQKLQSAKSKGDAHDAFAGKASAGKLGTLKPNTEMSNAKNVSDYLDRWILVLNVQYLATPNSKFSSDGMKAHIVDRDGMRNELWINGVLRQIIEQNVNEETMTFPTLLKVVRPGRSFLPSREEAPPEVVSFFEAWIAKNGTDIPDSGDIPF